MFKYIKSTIKSSIIYGLGNLISKLIGLILLPLYTSCFSIEQFGIIGLLELTSQIIITIFGLGLNYALERWYFDTKYISKQKSIFYTVFISTLIIAIFVSILSVLLSKAISYFLFNSYDFQYLIILMAVSASIEFISAIPLSLLRLQEKSIRFSMNQFFRFTATLILTVFFVIFLKRGLNSIYEARVIALLVSLLTLSQIILSNSKFIFERGILIDMLKFRLPLILSSLSFIILAATDRFALTFLGTITDVGQYTMAYKLGNTIKVIVISSIWLAIMPIIYKVMDKENNKRFYSKIITYMTYISLIFVIPLTLFGKEIIILMANNKPEYFDSYKLIGFICYAMLFDVLHNTSLIGLNISKKTKIIGAIISVSAIFNLLINILLIPKWGTYGSAVATLLSQILLFALTYYYAQKSYYINYELKKVFLLIIVSLIICFIGIPINYLSVYISIPLKLLLCVSFPIILYLFNFYEQVEIERIKGIIKNWRNIDAWKSFIHNS